MKWISSVRTLPAARNCNSTHRGQPLLLSLEKYSKSFKRSTLPFVSFWHVWDTNVKEDTGRDCHFTPFPRANLFGLFDSPQGFSALTQLPISQRCPAALMRCPTLRLAPLEVADHLILMVVEFSDQMSPFAGPLTHQKKGHHAMF